MLTISTTKVKNLVGLENVRSYGGLRIEHNSELVTTSQLRSSSVVGRKRRDSHLFQVSHVSVLDCGILEDVQGLRGITTISGMTFLEINHGVLFMNDVSPGSLTIVDNKLADLTGLDGLTDVDGDVSISMNQLSTLNGLNMLQTVGGMLKIDQNLVCTV